MNRRSGLKIALAVGVLAVGGVSCVLTDTNAPPPEGTGGSVAGTGGTPGSGGHVGTGGNGGPSGTGGSATGGSNGGTGGRGGAVGSGGGGGAAGGSVGTGGRGTGGGPGSGGMPGTGGAPPGTGGAAATACTIGPASNGSGSFTNYSFGQGTGMENGYYVTACGYHGHEPSGSGSDTVENVANMGLAKAGYFAAIPSQSPSNFDTAKYCGACAQVTNGSKSVIVTIIDACPENSNPPCQQNPNGHLDLSVVAFNQLGYSVGNPKSTTWKFVPCPVTGNVVVRVKSGNPNEIFIENGITSIASVSMNGTQASRQSYGAWHFNNNIPANAMLELTDIAGRKITVEVKSTTQNQNQDTGVQFPQCQ
jgi:hypothetical protein